MKALFTGIYSLFAPAGAKPTIWTNLSGQFYLTQAPQNTDYPYAVYHLIANDYDWMFAAKDFEEFLIQITIFDDKASASNIGTYFENMKSLYDWATPTVTGYTAVWMVREFAELLKPDNIWQYVIQYRVLLEKN